MDLVSCDNCGVVFDRNKIIFPDQWDVENDCVNTNVASWDGEKHVTFVECPVCEAGEIPEED